jgi:hypothetical protein
MHLLTKPGNSTSSEILTQTLKPRFCAVLMSLLMVRSRSPQEPRPINHSSKSDRGANEAFSFFSRV